MREVSYLNFIDIRSIDQDFPERRSHVTDQHAECGGFPRTIRT